MDGYAKYRLTDYSFIPEYKDKMGEDEFWAYADKVTMALSLLKVGHYYDLSDKQLTDPNLFIKICCILITDTGMFEFNDSYTIITRIR